MADGTAPLFACLRYDVLAQRDAIEWLGTVGDESIDLVITDPPYESLEKHRAKGTTTRLKHSKASSNDWFPIFPNARFPALFREVFRVLRADTHFYMFCDQETMFVAKPLVWDKGRLGMGYHYRCRYELVLFFEKGKRRLNDLGVPDVISSARIVNGYPTEKPLAVSEVFVRQSSQPGDLVIDPFMGSGSVGVAALRNGRRFAGCDVTEAAVKLTRERLAKEEDTRE